MLQGLVAGTVHAVAGTSSLVCATFMQCSFITILYHVLENAVANTIHATCMWPVHDGKVGCNAVKYTMVFKIVF